MKPRITITDQSIDSSAPQMSSDGYKTRLAARGVVYDDNFRVGLLYVTKHNYYKLPGGGVDAGEDVIDAFKRECLEEIGCNVEVGLEPCETVEQRDQFKMLQTSRCFVARKIGESVETTMTDSEIERGFEVVWVDGIDAALSKVEEASPTTYEGKFIQLRDLAILKVAKALHA